MLQWMGWAAGGWRMQAEGAPIGKETGGCERMAWWRFIRGSLYRVGFEAKRRGPAARVRNGLGETRRYSYLGYICTGYTNKLQAPPSIPLYIDGCAARPRAVRRVRTHGRRGLLQHVLRGVVQEVQGQAPQRLPGLRYPEFRRRPRTLPDLPRPPRSRTYTNYTFI